MDNNSKIKASIGLVVLGIIAFFTWKGISGNIGDKETSAPPPNQFVDRVEVSINNLKASQSLDKSKYVDCIAEIEDFHRQNLLGSNSNDNDRWKDVLKKNAYSVYAPKFVNHAMSIFKGSIWNSSDLVFIRKEVSTLSKSSYLDSESTVASSFTKIENILNKYHEIRIFISSCKSSYDINSFGSLVSKSKSYLKGNGLDSYVLNCSSIVNDLRSIPSSLYQKHKSFLYAEVTRLAASFPSYLDYSDYKSSVYDPLKSYLDDFINI
jgi:hypothetical protein